MGNGKPILRVGKIKATGSSTLRSVEAHLTRSRPTHNADTSRTKHNEVLHGDPSQSLTDAVQAVYSAHGIERASLRKDATLANDIVLTCSPEWFRPDDPDAAGRYDLNRLRAFRGEAMQFLRKEFGTRLVRVDLHLDEATPHIHAIVVPVLNKKDGTGFRLSSKDLFNPGKLTQLQQRWQDSMAQHGVGERLKRSTAKHTKLRDYYSAIAATSALEDVKLTPAPPPKKGMLQSQADHDKEVEEWRKAEAKRLREELRPHVNDAAMGRLYEAERLTAQAARSDASQSLGRLYGQSEQLAKLHEELNLAKEEVSRLRQLPIQRVAEALGWDGPILPRENPIDLVKRVGGLEFKPAVAWIYQNLGRDAMAVALADQAAQNMPSEAVWTKADHVKRDTMQEQLSALDAPAYRVSIVHDNGRRWIFGRDETRDGTMTKDELLQRVPELARENVRGAHIYVTPISPTQHYLLVDDLDWRKVEELKGVGYAPAVLQETSRANFQMVLRVPRAGLNEAAVNAFFKDMNKARGDDRVVGLEHPFRLAGFMNRKPKHRDPQTGHYPFVKLIGQQLNQTCRTSLKIIRDHYMPKFLKRDESRTKTHRPKGP